LSPPIGLASVQGQVLKLVGDGVAPSESDGARRLALVSENAGRGGSCQTHGSSNRMVIDLQLGQHRVAEVPDDTTSVASTLRPSRGWELMGPASVEVGHARAG
jgi:hypothetical protein